MSELARSLRRQMGGGFPHGNPLVNIGVSADVLDLGLTEDELYDYLVKGVARQLVMRIHPDRVGVDKRPDLELLQRKYNRVYEELQDRATFTKALAEFRSLKAEDRSEMKILRRGLESTRQLLSAYQAKEVELEEGTRQLRHDQQALQRDATQQHQVASKMETRVEWFQQETEATKKASALKIRDVKMVSARNYRRYRDISRYVSYLGSNSNDFGESIHTLEARWVVVASLVPGLDSRVPLPTKWGKWTRDFRRATWHLGMSARDSRRVVERWKVVFEKLNTPGEGETEVLTLRLHALELFAGKSNVAYGWKGMSKRGRVIGSYTHPLQTPVGRRHLTQLIERDTMFERLVPFLVVGGLLVSEKTEKIASNSTVVIPTPLFQRETRSLILGVG